MDKTAQAVSYTHLDVYKRQGKKGAEIDTLRTALEKVDVIGTSKGKGFQGRIKLWGQRRGPMTHVSHFQRHPGSIGQCAYPARVLKMCIRDRGKAFHVTSF